MKTDAMVKKSILRTFKVISITLVFLLVMFEAGLVLAGQARLGDSPVAFAVSPQTLSVALTDFQNDSGVNVIYKDKFVQGKTTSGLKGKYLPAAGLKKLLVGTGLTYQVTAENTVVLKENKMFVAQREEAKKEQSEEKEEVKRPVEIEQMVVTATKTEEKIRDIPTSVSVVYGAEIKASGARVVADYLQMVPGIQLEDVAGSGVVTMMTMRGMPHTNSNYILILVDGIPQNAETGNVRWGTIPIEMIERIEVIRGPASALYGMNAMGGVINIITKKPLQTEGNVSAGYGSYEENKERAYFSTIHDKFGISVGAVRHASEGKLENSAFEKYNVYGKIAYEFSEDTNLALNLFYSDWNNEWRDGVSFDDWEAGKRELDVPTHMNEIHSEPSAALIFNHRFNEQFKLTNRFYARTIDSKWRDLMDLLDDDRDDLKMGDEIQLQFGHDIFHRKNKIITGFHFDHEDAEFERRFSQYFSVPSMRGEKIAETETTRQVSSAYIQDIFQLTKCVTISAGTRYDYVDFDFKNELDDTKSGKDTMDHWSPKLGIAFNPIKELNFFTNFGTGFKAPSASQVAQYENLKAENATSCEVGIRGFLLDRLNFQAAYYYTKMKDQISSVQDPSSPTGFTLKNAGESKMCGFEFEGTFFILDSLSLFGTYTHNKSEYIDFYDQANGDMSGNDLAWQPRNKITGGIRYVHPIGISAMLTTKWIDKQYLSGLNEYEMDSYTTTDIKLTYTHKSGLEASLSVRNLFDEDYASYGEHWGGGSGFLTAGDPLTFFCEASYRF